MNEWQKTSQNVFLSAPFCVLSVDGAKSLQGSVQRDPTSPCKIASKSVPLYRSYLRKDDFVRIQYMHSAYHNGRNSVGLLEESLASVTHIGFTLCVFLLFVALWFFTFTLHCLSVGFKRLSATVQTIIQNYTELGRGHLRFYFLSRSHEI